MTRSRGRASSQGIDDEIRSLRWWGIIYATAFFAAIVGGIALTTEIYADEVEQQHRVNTLIATRPHMKATVFEVRQPPGASSDSVGRIEIDDNIFEIQNLGSFSWWDLIKGDDRYEVGDRVTVVTDPNGPDHAWNVDDQDALSLWSRMNTLLVIWGLLGLMAKFVLWRLEWRLPVPLRALRHFIQPSVATAQVKEFREIGTIENLLEPNPLATLVVEINGRPHVWEVHSYESMNIDVGATFDVWGAPRLGGWVVGMTNPKLYPRSPLD